MEFSSCNLPKHFTPSNWDQLIICFRIFSSDQAGEVWCRDAHHVGTLLGLCPVAPGYSANAQKVSQDLRASPGPIAVAERIEDVATWTLGLCTWGHSTGMVFSAPRHTKKIQETSSIRRLWFTKFTNSIMLVGGLEHVLFFHSVENVIIPTDELHHFSEG